MQTTAQILTETAHIITVCGLHTGRQFAATDSDAIDICAAIYMAAEGTCPTEFATDEDTSLAIISASAPTMAAIRALSDALYSDVCETEIAPGYWVPDYIEHVSHWAATPPIGETTPPTVDEVIGRILRTAGHTPQTTTRSAA